MLIHKYINYYANVFVLLSIDASPYRFFWKNLKKFIFLYYGFFVVCYIDGLWLDW